MADAAIQLAETIQTAHINRQPSPSHDVNPSTAASTREPVVISPQSSSPAASIASDEVPLSALRPQRRHNPMPPLPDLRFEQSYLASIKDAKSPWIVAWITIRDQVWEVLSLFEAFLEVLLAIRLWILTELFQVFLPLLQGTLWSLVISGWRYFNRSTQFSGHSVGARIRRWWWGVNDWKIPTEKPRLSLNNKQLADDVGDVSFFICSIFYAYS